MLNLLKNVNKRTEEFKGTRLVTLLIVVFVTFLTIGFATNYFIDQILKSNEVHETSQNVDNQNENRTEYSGVVSFVDARKYPEDKISYLLKDNKGKEIVLLKANDQKLEAVEGLYVTVIGNLTKTKDNKQKLLMVNEVLVKNTPNKGK